ncbi:MAG TPA: cobalamin biosynthesis protein CbiD [Desulfotomaculum sp.]|nr:cobalamin biosynthesis protein CbiD [Desulfotomaculum sp.]
MLEPVVVKGKKLRRGFTTGTCAAAAAKGATMMLFSPDPGEEVEVTLPAGLVIKLKIQNREKRDSYARCCVIKDAGDDPDVTNGLAIWATAKKIKEGIHVKGGQGVGIVTRPGLAVAPGQPAINPGPLAMIKNEVEKAFLACRGVKFSAPTGVEITIQVPEGEVVARKTMNSRLGIQGGISILGTTGLVEPMSEEAFKTSLTPQISQAIALGYKDIVMTPGRQSEKWAIEKYGLPAEAVVQMSNFVGYMLEECGRLGVKKVLLFGPLGKLVKVAAGIFHTHNRLSDARRETIMAHAALAGANQDIIKQIWECATTNEAVKIIKSNNLNFLFNQLAHAASKRATEYGQGKLFIGTVFTSLKGEILGLDREALVIAVRLRSSVVSANNRVGVF